MGTQGVLGHAELDCTKGHGCIRMGSETADASGGGIAAAGNITGNELCPLGDAEQLIRSLRQFPTKTRAEQTIHNDIRMLTEAARCRHDRNACQLHGTFSGIA